MEKITLQKLLFLFTQRQSKPAFHFVPYKFGCFSFQANADLGTLGKYDLVRERENEWSSIAEESYLSAIRPADQLLLDELKHKYQKKSSQEILLETYREYPYYAINSQIAEKVLEEEELKAVARQKPTPRPPALLTIGYEGKPLEVYINTLILEGVKVLCDVRKNSFSMKYGFSKSQLKAACEGVGIQFLHLPEVGIVSEKRKALKTQADYDRLFAAYREEVLPQTLETQQYILSLIEQHGRVALTCFEADECQCHRTHLANAITQHEDFNYNLLHL
ncbi:DUF488 domain-containing protein [Phaeodactylibacter luteus]|nr:DUF488 domain-containing protein [Phaeodactylibacter luteus]